MSNSCDLRDFWQTFLKAKTFLWVDLRHGWMQFQLGSLFFIFTFFFMVKETETRDIGPTVLLGETALAAGSLL